MSVVDTTVPGQTETLRFELALAHAPQTVWRALSTPELLSQWLLPTTDLTLAPGAPFTLQAPPQPGWNGRVLCRVLEVEELRRLRIRWVVGELDTIVTMTLEADGVGSRLHIEHTGFASTQKANFGGARYGWRQFTGRLTALFDDTVLHRNSSQTANTPGADASDGDKR